MERMSARGAASGSAGKEAKEQVPGEKVRDAPALARELRWRVNLALNDESGDEREQNGVDSSAGGGLAPVKSLKNGGGMKRKLSETPEGDEGVSSGLSARFRNFRPKMWDAQESTSKEETLHPDSSRRPPEGDGTEWTKYWIQEGRDVKTEDGDSMAVDGDGESSKAKVRRTDTSLTRVRKTPVGLERQQITRRVEFWEWDA